MIFVGRRVATIDDIERAGDYCLTGEVDQEGNSVGRGVWFLLPLHEGESLVEDVLMSVEVEDQVLAALDVDEWRDSDEVAGAVDWSPSYVRASLLVLFQQSRVERRLRRPGSRTRFEYRRLP